MRLTRGGELGRALGCACSSGVKTGYGFHAAPGRALGWNLGGELGCAVGRAFVQAFATRRVAQFAATPRGGLQLVGARCAPAGGELL